MNRISRLVILVLCLSFEVFGMTYKKACDQAGGFYSADPQDCVCYEGTPVTQGQSINIFWNGGQFQFECTTSTCGELSYVEEASITGVGVYVGTSDGAVQRCQADYNKKEAEFRSLCEKNCLNCAETVNLEVRSTCADTVRYNIDLGAWRAVAVSNADCICH